MLGNASHFCLKYWKGVWFNRTFLNGLLQNSTFTYLCPLLTYCQRASLNYHLSIYALISSIKWNKRYFQDCILFSYIEMNSTLSFYQIIIKDRIKLRCVDKSISEGGIQFWNKILDKVGYWLCYQIKIIYQLFNLLSLCEPVPKLFERHENGKGYRV